MLAERNKAQPFLLKNFLQRLPDAIRKRLIKDHAGK